MKYTVDELCSKLRISRATAENWIRLGKLTPDAGNRMFSGAYVENVKRRLQTDDTTALRSRRNKKSAHGKMLYRDYVETPENRRMVGQLLEMDVVHTRDDMLVVLANFAMQLYYQSQGIENPGGCVLPYRPLWGASRGFWMLLDDLLGGISVGAETIDRLHDALSLEVKYVYGEDTLGFVYITLSDIGRRKRGGIYYTPGRVVSELLDSVCGENVRGTGYEARMDSDGMDRDGVSAIPGQQDFCDPCCGTGNFLIGLAERGVDCGHIYGRDIDPVSVNIARINLALMCPCAEPELIRSHITVGDSLLHMPDRRYDVVLGNPPWGGELTDDEAVKCREMFRTAAGRNIETYDLFVEKSLSVLDEGGLAALVLPEAVLSVKAHRAVRELLIRTCSFKFLTYLGEVFPGVQCPSVILGVEKQPPNHVCDACEAADSGAEPEPDEDTTADSAAQSVHCAGCRVTSGGRSYVIKHMRECSDSRLPLNMTDEEYGCLRAIEDKDNAVYLKGRAGFALGIVTGDNRRFVMSEAVPGSERVLAGCDIHRYGIAEADRYIRFEPQNFQQTAPEEMYRAPEKLVYRFIYDMPVFAYDDRQLLSLNSCNILIPEIEGMAIKYVLAILNSSVAEYYMRMRFHSVKLLRSHIESLPIPVAPPDMQSVIESLVNRIMADSDGACAEQTYRKLDGLIMDLYGLSDAQREIVKSMHTSKSALR